jgi:exosortase
MPFTLSACDPQMKSFSHTLVGRHICFVLVWALSLVIFHVPLSQLLYLSSHDEKYSHLLLIPLISAWLVYFERGRIFLQVKYCLAVAAPGLLAGVTLHYFAERGALAAGAHAGLSFDVIAIIMIWAAGFVLCYGVQPLCAAAFQFLFLLLMIPIPATLLENLAVVLQKGSAEIAYVMFKLVGMPVFRQGFKFALPGVNIQIAEECSGLRSCVALLITSMLAGRLFLLSNMNRIYLCVLAVPIAIFKNAVRIVTISWLGINMNPAFLYGNLHRYGGVLFSLLGLAVLVPVLFAFQRAEMRRDRQDLKSGPAVPSEAMPVLCVQAGRQSQF